MKYLAVFLSFIIVSIIILSAGCLITDTSFEHSYSSPCVGSCVASASSAYLTPVNYSDFNKLLFIFTFSLLLTILNLKHSYNFNKKNVQNDFKILFSLNKHIQAGLLHPKIY
jgi:hypothetical protein